MGTLITNDNDDQIISVFYDSISAANQNIRVVLIGYFNFFKNLVPFLFNAIHL